MLLRGAAQMRHQANSTPRQVMGMMGVRGFRNDFVNPYKQAPIHISEHERTT